MIEMLLAQFFCLICANNLCSAAEININIVITNFSLCRWREDARRKLRTIY